MNENDRRWGESDPLAGSDSWPVDHLDLLPLTDERAELLEEIVSTDPHAPTGTGGTRVLLPVAAVVILALLGGGFWFITSDRDDSGDDTVAAESSGDADSSDDASGATDPSSTPSADDASADDPGTVDDVAEATKGDRLSEDACNDLLARSAAYVLVVGDGKVRVRTDQPSEKLRKLSQLPRRLTADKLAKLEDEGIEIGLQVSKRRMVVIDATCTVKRTGKAAHRFGAWTVLQENPATPSPRG